MTASFHRFQNDVAYSFQAFSAMQDNIHAAYLNIELFFMICMYFSLNGNNIKHIARYWKI
jgi:hypothetical protein